LLTIIVSRPCDGAVMADRTLDNHCSGVMYTSFKLEARLATTRVLESVECYTASTHTMWRLGDPPAVAFFIMTTITLVIIIIIIIIIIITIAIMAMTEVLLLAFIDVAVLVEEDDVGGV